MNPENTGSQEPEVQPVPAPSTEQPPVAPAPSADPATPPAPPVEGQEPPAPAAEPATPPEPRETAMQKRARELRERADGERKLADKLDPTGAQAAPATPAVAEPTPPQPGPAEPQVPDYFDPETGEIDPIKLSEYVNTVAEKKADERLQERNTQAQLEAARTKYVSDVTTDAQTVATEYPELNPESDQYDQELDDFLTDQYQRMTTNSQGQVIRIDVGLKDFVDGQMKIISRTRTKAAAQTPNADAAAGLDVATAPDPGTPPATDRPFAELSIEEMEAKLGKPRR